MTGWRIIVGLSLGTAVSLCLLWIGDFPFGVSGEWTWHRVKIHDGHLTPALLGIAIGAIVGGIYLGFAWVGLKRIGNATRWESAGWLSGSTIVGFLLLFTVQSVPTAPATRIKTVWVLYDRGASGYFADSVFSNDDVATFLATYESKMAAGDVFHIGTHPPGLFLGNRALLAICRQSPALSSAVLRTQPNSSADAFTALERQTRKPRKLNREERAALWLSAMITQGIAAAVVIPLFLLVSATHGRRAAWMSAAFWPLVPAISVFLPKSDALLPFMGMMFLWLWCEAIRRRSLLFAAAAGASFWVGLTFSLALLPIGLLAVLLTCWETWIRIDEETTPAQRFRRNVNLAACAASVFLAATALVWFACDLNLFNVWAWNLRNHAAFYDQVGFPRTYWKWLLVNPIELAVATGWPIVFFAVAAAVRDWRASSSADEARSARTTTLGAAVCCLAIWSVLWLSGKNMGEAARLWLFLMPWFLWVGAALWAPLKNDSSFKNSPPSPHLWIFGLGLQLLICLLTVARVNGFQFGV